MEWLPSALTGGLAGSLLTLFVTWLRAKGDLKQAKVTQLSTLKQELQLSLWLIDYNYGRITNRSLLYTGLTPISISNVERVLFDTRVPLPLKDDLNKRLLDYFQQVVYLNSLVAEQAALSPVAPYNFVSDRQGSCLGEIQAICTPKETYERNPNEASLRARVKQLLQDLDKLKI